MDMFSTIFSKMSETYLERSKKMSWMVLNMSRTTLQKFVVFDMFPIFLIFFRHFCPRAPMSFFGGNNWNTKDAGGPYDQFGGGERP